MDNSLNSVDRLAPYTGSGKVAASHHPEKDKHRKNSETLEQSFEDELEQEQKEQRHDTVALHKDAQGDDSEERDDTDSTDETTGGESPDEESEPDRGHVDLRA